MSFVISERALGFMDAMAAQKLQPSEIVSDGNLHRFSTAEDKGTSKSGWYVLYDDGSIVAGAYGDWRTGISEKWCSERKDQVSPDAWLRYAELVQQAKARADVERILAQEAAAKSSLEIWEMAKPAPAENPYCHRKGIKPFGVRELTDKTLLVPIRDEFGSLTSLQFIAPDGTKRFKSDGKIKGCYHSIEGKPTSKLLVCEGFATGASLHEATGYPVAVAFNAGNLETVAAVLRSKLGDAIMIIICADNDNATEHKTGKNTGIIAATAAAISVSGHIAIPHFQSGDRQLTDFNDLHLSEGLQAVKTVIESVSGTHVWHQPEPLVRSATAVPYPVDVLPEVILNAVKEVQGFTKAPMAMVACSAMANISLAAQAHYDVQRAEKLTGAISLYFLVIAESGERKTTCDGMFSVAIRDYENQQQEEAKPALREFNAQKAIWDATRSGLLDAIKQEARGKKQDGVNAQQLEHELHNHEKSEPQAPRVPRLIYSDFTPEALTYALGTKWPSGGVISSEAGAVFGSHGMGKDSQLRTLANLNQLWDAAKLTFDRRGESYIVDGARLTMSLQVQESALLDFINRTGTLARGTGFLARFLLAHPESTQGTRLFTEPPVDMPALTKLHKQITRILQTPAPINERGGLETTMLPLSPDAKAAWIKFHDEIESALGAGGELQDVRDVASKIADNAARIAALFHIIDAGAGAISLSHFESASVIAAWHLNEALRFLGDLALPEELTDAATLDDWLIRYCKANRVDKVSTRTISQYAPNKLRNKAKRDTAIQELIHHGRIVLVQNSKKQEIQINPQLLEG
ncbi:DUF3987 domain-containing protein [Undibacterium sp. WLX3042]|uniref:DUF3987 domain-containing protein n=1 Tax=Undibacterium sp. WLX3042 TaxID=3412686 RepID=UPI003C3089C6